MLLRLVLTLAVACFFGACGRSLPKYEKPIARANFQHVRTTAYTHTESDHLVHGHQTCVGTCLRCGTMNSAAADWSRWPFGTTFRIIETGELYQVDDIGWALSGRNTIDLYKPTKSAMNQWGVRNVNIEILKWGEDRDSQRLLSRRSKYKHVKRMLVDLGKRIARGAKNPEPNPIVLESQAPVATVVNPVSSAVSAPQPNGGLRPRGSRL